MPGGPFSKDFVDALKDYYRPGGPGEREIEESTARAKAAGIDVDDPDAYYRWLMGGVLKDKVPWLDSEQILDNALGPEELP